MSLTQKNLNKSIQYTLLKYGSLILLFAIMKGLFMYFMRQTVIVMSRKIEFDLKNEIYQKYQNLDISFYKKNNTGDLMNRITEDVNRVRMYLGPTIMYIKYVLSFYFSNIQDVHYKCEFNLICTYSPTNFSCLCLFC